MKGGCKRSGRGKESWSEAGKDEREGTPARFNFTQLIFLNAKEVEEE